MEVLEVRPDHRGMNEITERDHTRGSTTLQPAFGVPKERNGTKRDHHALDDEQERRRRVKPVKGHEEEQDE